MAARDTVVDAKKAFITSESRLLNAPLEIPYHWHNRVVSEEDSNLGAGVIDEVLEKREASKTRTFLEGYSPRVLTDETDSEYDSPPSQQGRVLFADHSTRGGADRCPLLGEW